MGQATLGHCVFVCTELTRVVYAVQQFDGASTDHSSDVDQKTRWEGRQSEEGKLLQIENSLVTYNRGQHTLDISYVFLLIIFSEYSMIRTFY